MKTLVTVPGEQEITIRFAGKEDLERIHTIESSCFDDPWPAADFRWLHEQPLCDILVVESQAAGICGFSISRYSPPLAEIIDIAILPQVRRQGYAALLLEAATRQSVAHLCHTIFLEVRCSNQAAISLYERNGYTETGKIQKYYADGEDGLQLRRLITDSEESAVNAIRTEDKK